MLAVNNINIQQVSKLKILGVIFQNNYRWNEHVAKLKKDLVARTNLIKYLSTRSYTHINTLTYLVKTLILSKIDYGLFLFGNSPKSTLSTISSVYHDSIRASIYAYRTTPIKSLLIESGLPALEERIHVIINRLIPKTVFSNSSVIKTDVSKILSSKRIPKTPSALYNCIKNNILSMEEQLTEYKPRFPPW